MKPPAIARIGAPPVRDKQTGRPAARKVYKIEAPGTRSLSEIDDPYPVAVRDFGAVPVKRRERAGQKVWGTVSNNGRKNPWNAQRCRCHRTGSQKITSIQYD